MDEAPGHPRPCGSCDTDADDDEPFTVYEDDDADYGLDPEGEDEEGDER